MSHRRRNNRRSAELPSASADRHRAVCGIKNRTGILNEDLDPEEAPPPAPSSDRVLKADDPARVHATDGYIVQSHRRRNLKSPRPVSAALRSAHEDVIRHATFTGRIFACRKEMRPTLQTKKRAELRRAEIRREIFASDSNNRRGPYAPIRTDDAHHRVHTPIAIDDPGGADARTLGADWFEMRSSIHRAITPPISTTGYYYSKM